MMMKRFVSFVLCGVGAAILFGCPIYSADRDHRVCVGSDCYGCPDPYASECGGSYVPNDTACTRPSDCVGGNCGSDNKCHAGDCSTSGCPSNFVCKLTNGAAQCVPVGSGGATSACKNDRDCPSPAGSKCLTGACVAPQDQCADATQCPAGAACVGGACTPTCSKSRPCPTGYACDEDKGVCSENPAPCTSSNQCGGAKVCVQEHCVDPCNPDSTCGPGLACVDGGCTPDQKPVFTCNKEGAQDSCQQGSLCLRHSCYIACDADAGADACKSADTFNQCKPVTTGSGTYSVCGSTSNLGTECDPTQNKRCTSPLVCIDGYCK